MKVGLNPMTVSRIKAAQQSVWGFMNLPVHILAAQKRGRACVLPVVCAQSSANDAGMYSFRQLESGPYESDNKPRQQCRLSLLGLNDEARFAHYRGSIKTNQGNYVVDLLLGCPCFTGKRFYELGPRGATWPLFLCHRSFASHWGHLPHIGARVRWSLTTVSAQVFKLTTSPLYTFVQTKLFVQELLPLQCVPIGHDESA